MTEPMTIDLERLRRQLEYVARTTLCSACGHALNLHWAESVRVEDEDGTRRYCVKSGCDCIPSWAVPS